MRRQFMLETIRFSSVAFLLVLLAGCAATAAVFLRHPKTGETVQCGPYPYTGYTATAVAIQERGCIEDFQRQGYERVMK
jgi:hypothetical protein